MEEYKKSFKNAEHDRNVDKNGKCEVKDQDPDELKSDSVNPIHREIDSVKKPDSFAQIVNKEKRSRSGGIRLISK